MKLTFFAKTVEKLNTFLVLYQTEKPLVPFLAQSMEDAVIRLFSSTFMLGEKLKFARTCQALSKLNFKDSTCHECASEITMSIRIKVELSHLKVVKKVSDTKLLQFKSGVILFLAVLCAHIAEKSAIKYRARNATCFFPCLFVEAPEISERRFSRLLETLLGKIVKQAKIEFTKFLQHVYSIHDGEYVESGISVKDRGLYAFCFKYFQGVLSYSNLAEVF